MGFMAKLLEDDTIHIFNTCTVASDELFECCECALLCVSPHHT